MEAQSRGHVELRVGVVHAVEAPQGRDGVKKDVLEVDGEIEDHHGTDEGDPSRHVHGVKEAQSLRLAEEGETHRRSGKNEPDEKAVHDHDPEIRRPATPAGNCLLASRGENLPQRHERENPKEDRGADDGFVSEKVHVFPEDGFLLKT